MRLSECARAKFKNMLILYIFCIVKKKKRARESVLFYTPEWAGVLSASKQSTGGAEPNKKYTFEATPVLLLASPANQPMVRVVILIGLR